MLVHTLDDLVAKMSQEIAPAIREMLAQTNEETFKGMIPPYAVQRANEVLGLMQSMVTKLDVIKQRGMAPSDDFKGLSTAAISVSLAGQNALAALTYQVAQADKFLAATTVNSD